MANRMQGRREPRGLAAGPRVQAADRFNQRGQGGRVGGDIHFGRHREADMGASNLVNPPEIVGAIGIADESSQMRGLPPLDPVERHSGELRIGSNCPVEAPKDGRSNLPRHAAQTVSIFRRKRLVTGQSPRADWLLCQWGHVHPSWVNG